MLSLLKSKSEPRYESQTTQPISIADILQDLAGSLDDYENFKESRKTPVISEQLDSNPEMLAEADSQSDDDEETKEESTVVFARKLVGEAEELQQVLLEKTSTKNSLASLKMDIETLLGTLVQSNIK